VPVDRFSDSVRIAAPPAEIYAHLLDPTSYIGLSPLVVAVRDVRPVGDSVAYVAVERFRLGPLHRDNPIRVTLTGEVPDVRLVSDVRSPGAVRLTAVVDLAPTPDGNTTLTESIEVRSPALLRGFVVKQARSVQRHRLAELARRFDR
jgi:hypothetical protein